MKSIFVYNPESGNGKLNKYEGYIVRKLEQKYGEIEVVPTTHAGHATALAQNAIGKYDYFFCAGGDGTLNEVINGFGNAENKPIIGYIPCGTVNDVARSLGLTTNVKKAVKILINGKPQEHDTFKVNNKYGIYVCCTGLFTKSSYSTDRTSKKKLGKLAYFIKGGKEIFDTRPVYVELETENEHISKSCTLVLILNSRSVAGFKLNKEAALDDGMVEVVMFHSDKNKVLLTDIIRTMGAFAFGLESIKNNVKVTYRKLSKFTLTTSEGTIINLDGEKSAGGSFDFEVINKGISIICPTKTKERKWKKQ